MKKRFISMLLVIVMVVTMIPATAFAKEEANESSKPEVTLVEEEEAGTQEIELPMAEAKLQGLLTHVISHTLAREQTKYWFGKDPKEQKEPEPYKQCFEEKFLRGTEGDFYQYGFYSTQLLNVPVEHEHSAYEPLYPTGKDNGGKDNLEVKETRTDKNYYPLVSFESDGVRTLYSGEYCACLDTTLKRTVDGDMKLNGYLYIPKGATVTLCLNDYAINLNGYQILNYGTLTICDCHKGRIKPTTRYLKKDENGNWQLTDNKEGSVKVEGGVIYGGKNILSVTTLKYGEGESATTAVENAVFQGGAIYNVGTINMYGGSIVGNSVESSMTESSYYENDKGEKVSITDYDAKGGAIANVGESTLNIYGGRFAYNSAIAKTVNTKAMGGAIYAGPDSTVNISGGTFEYNDATNIEFWDSEKLELLDKGEGTGELGGAVCAYGDVDFSRGIMQYNEAFYGGGIFMGGKESTLTMDYSEQSGVTPYLRINNNRAYCGGGIFTLAKANLSYADDNNYTVYKNIAYQGGGIYSVNDVTLSGKACVAENKANTYTLNGETRGGEGGGISIRGGSLTMKGGSIYKNEAGLLGGGVLCEGTFKMTNGKLHENKSGKQGGGLMATCFDIEGGTIEGNETLSAGGGILLYKSGNGSFTGTLNKNASIKDNKATDGAGGAMYTTGGTTLNVSNSQIKNNSAKTGGGAISTAGTVNVTNADISNNSAKRGGALEINMGGSATIKEGKLNRNTATSGGAIYNLSNLTVDGSSFGSNSAENGGAIYNGYQGAVDIKGGTELKKNSVNGNGGAIFNATKLTISGDTKITGNNAYYGGGIANQSCPKGCVSVENCTIENNKAYTGGGIWNYETEMSLDNAAVDGNTSDENGGGIWNYNSTITATGGSISKNDAAASGGGIYNNKGTLELKGLKISGNIATEYAGGIYNYNGALELTGSEVCDNTSSNIGGGIYNTNGSTATLSKDEKNNPVRVNGNTAATAGGIYNDKDCKLTITGGEINNNKSSETDAQTYGGGIANMGEMTATDLSVNGNKAYQGAGIYNVGKLNLTKASISDNTATDACGALCLTIMPVDASTTLKSDATLDNCTITGNKAQRMAVFFNQEGTATSLKDCKITQNESAGNSSTVYCLESISLRGDNTISDNTAAGNAGNVWINVGKELTLSNDFTGKIGVAINGGTGLFSNKTDVDKKQYFSSDDTQYVVSFRTTENKLELIEGHSCHGFATEDAFQATGGTVEGEYYMNRGIALTEDLIIGENKTLKLCINGKKLNLNGHHIINNGTLIICNCETGYGGVTGGHGVNGGAIENHGELKILNVMVTNNKVSGLGGGIYNDGVLHIDEATTIYGNLDDAETRNDDIYCTKKGIVTLAETYADPDENPANISLETGTGVFTGVNEKDFTNNFKANGYQVVKKDGKLWVAGKPVTIILFDKVQNATPIDGYHRYQTYTLPDGKDIATTGYKVSKWELGNSDKAYFPESKMELPNDQQYLLYSVWEPIIKEQPTVENGYKVVTEAEDVTYQWYKVDGIPVGTPVSGIPVMGQNSNKLTGGLEGETYYCELSYEEGGKSNKTGTVKTSDVTIPHICYDNEVIKDSFDGTADKEIYYMKADMSLEDNLVIESGTEMTLCLNGKTLDLKEHKIIINGKLTLLNCKETVGNVINGTVENNGTLITGGKLKANVYLASDKVVTLDSNNPLESGSEITVTTEANIAGTAITGKAAVSDVKHFKSGNDSFQIRYNKTDSNIVLGGKHTHNWSYVKEGDNKIIATCSESGCDIESMTLTLSASDTTYDGTEKPAKFDTRLIGDISVTEAMINYSDKNGETVDGVPVDAGTYTASLNIDDKIISVTYEVKKADPAPKDISFVPQENLVYDGKDKSASVTKANENIGDLTVTYIKNGETASAENAGTYTAKISVAESKNYNAKSDMTDDSWSFTVTKAENSITVEGKDNQALEYTGNPVALPNASSDGGEITTVITYYGEAVDQIKEKGKYSVTWSVSESENYEAAEDVVRNYIVTHVCHEEGFEQSVDFTGGSIEGGGYYLENDLELVSDLIVEEGETVNLCLYGYELNLNGHHIINNGTLNIYNCKAEGSITGGEAAKGGAIENTGNLSLVNVAVEDCSAYDCGGGIYCGKNSTLTIAEKTVIAGNKVGENESNVYLADSTAKIKIADSGLNDGAGIGVCHVLSAPVVFSEANDTDYSRFFTSDKNGLSVTYSDEKSLMLVNAHKHSKTEKTYSHYLNSGTLENGNYFMKDNYTATADIVIPKDTTVELCLNGKTLDLKGHRIINHGTLTICDCGSGKITGGTKGTEKGAVYSDGSLTLDEITVTENLGGGVAATGTLKLTGAVNITQNTISDIPTNLYLLDGHQVTIENGTKCSIGVTMESGAGQISVNSVENKTDDYIVSDIEGFYTLINGENKLEMKAHIHNWTYEADGNKITATCSVKGCDVHDNELIISAENSLYDGDEKKAELSATKIGGETVSRENIQYFIKGKTDAMATAPTKVGNYVAKITVQGKTAEKEFSILRPGVYYNDFTGTSMERKTKAAYTPVDSSTTELKSGLLDGWYAVLSNVNSEAVTVTGDVHLILVDGYTWDVGSITIAEGGSLTVYGGTAIEDAVIKDTGKINTEAVKGDTLIVDGGYIESNIDHGSGIDVKNFIQNGGTVVARGAAKAIKADTVNVRTELFIKANVRYYPTKIVCKDRTNTTNLSSNEDFNKKNVIISKSSDDIRYKEWISKEAIDELVDAVKNTNVVWDDENSCAVFSGDNTYLTITYPLAGVNITSGFSIKTEVRIKNNSTGKLIDFRSGNDKFTVSGTNSLMSEFVSGSTKTYERSDASDITGEWISLELIVSPGGYVTLYMNDTPVYQGAGDAAVQKVLRQISQYNTCYVGKGFKGEMRSLKIAPVAVRDSASNAEYNITYNSKGGSEIQAYTGVTVPYADELPKPVYSGYAFKGWYTDEALKTELIPESVLTSDITAYAKWDIDIHKHTDKSFEKHITDGGTLASGSYYLYKDVTLTQDISILSGKNVKICLDGHTLDLDGHKIINKGSLTLCDCGKGKIVGAAEEDWALKQQGTLTLSENVDISENAKNIYISKNRTIAMESGFSGKVGVTMQEGQGIFGANPFSNIKCFTSDDESYVVDLSDDGRPELTMLEKHEHDGITYNTAVLSADYLEGKEYKLESGHYFMREDVTLTSSITIEEGQTVDICLNGHVLNANLTGAAFINNGTLNICSCNEDEKHTFRAYDAETDAETYGEDAGEELLILDEKGKQLFSGGIITGGKAGAAQSGGGRTEVINGTLVTYKSEAPYVVVENGVARLRSTTDADWNEWYNSLSADIKELVDKTNNLTQIEAYNNTSNEDLFSYFKNIYMSNYSDLQRYLKEESRDFYRLIAPGDIGYIVEFSDNGGHPPYINIQAEDGPRMFSSSEHEKLLCIIDSISICSINYSHLIDNIVDGKKIEDTDFYYSSQTWYEPVVNLYWNENTQDWWLPTDKGYYEHFGIIKAKNVIADEDKNKLPAHLKVDENGDIVINEAGISNNGFLKEYFNQIKNNDGSYNYAKLKKEDEFLSDLAAWDSPEEIGFDQAHKMQCISCFKILKIDIFNYYVLWMPDMEGFDEHYGIEYETKYYKQVADGENFVWEEITLNAGSAKANAIENHGTLNVKGITLMGNAGGGSTVYSDAGTVTVSDCVLSHNSSSTGSVVTADGAEAQVTLENTEIENNVSGNGTINSSAGTLNVKNSRVHDNTAQSGGAIYAKSTATLENCTLTDNKATENGGAVKTETGAAVTLKDTKVTGNNADKLGGGVYHEAGGFTVSGNTVISDNKADSVTSNVYLPNEKGTEASLITGDNPGDYSYIGVSVKGEEYPIVITDAFSDKTTADNARKHFVSDIGRVVAVNAENKLQLIAHEHQWKYEVITEDTLTATCITSGCDAPGPYEVSILAPSDCEYDGTEKKALLSDNNMGLDSDKITYTTEDGKPMNNPPKEPGKYIATLTADGEKKISKAFDITKKADEKLKVDDISAVTYNSKAQTPKVTVRDGDKVLKEGQDYDTVYENNINAGTAKAKINLKGNYSGCIEKGFTIKPAGILITELYVYPKSADGTTDATISFSTEGIYDSDVTVSANASFDNAEVGTDKTVTVNYVVNGENSKNYSSIPTAYLSGDIISAKNDSCYVAGIPNRTYNGREQTPEPVITDGAKTLEKGRDYELNYKNNVNVGTATAVVIFTGNYGGTREISFDIVPVQLSVSSVAVYNKVYDGTKKADILMGDVNGIVDGEDVTVKAKAEFDSANAGVREATVEFKLEGEAAANYTVPTDMNVAAEIYARKITVTKPSVSNKSYDGTAKANVTVETVSGVIEGDEVTVKATGTYLGNNAEAVGENKNIKISYILEGEDAVNYIAPADENATANITVKQLTLSDEVTVKTKTYDGTTDAELENEKKILGIVEGEDVKVTCTAEFDDKNAGTEKTVTVSYALEGDDKDYYIAPEGFTLTGTIVPKEITEPVTSDIEELIYNGETQIPTVTLKDGELLLENEDFAATYSNNKNAGEANAHFEFKRNFCGEAQDISFPISKRVVNLDGAKVSNKTYDGTTNAIVIANASNIIKKDRTYVTAEGSFSDAEVGTDKTVSVIYKLTGAGAGNYELSKESDTLKADINAKTVTITGAVAENKAYDGTSIATVKVDEAKITGVAEGEDVAVKFVSARFDNPNIGTDKNVTATYKLTGADAKNYEIGDSEMLMADITKIEAKDNKNFSVMVESLVYNGEARVASVIIVDESIGESGTQLIYGSDYTVEYAEHVHAGEYPVKIHLKGSYSGDLDGTLVIEPKPITLTSASKTKEYDATALTDSTITDSGFVKDEKFIYEVTGSQTDFGTSKNTFTYKAAEGTTLSDYNVKTVYGDLTVTKNEKNSLTDVKLLGSDDNQLSDSFDYGTEYIPTATAKFGEVKYAYKVQGSEDSTYTSTKPAGVGKYTVKAYVEKSASYNAVEAVKNYEIKIINQEKPVVTEMNNTKAISSITLNTQTGYGATKYGYSSDGSLPTSWQSGNKITGLERETEYYFFIKFEGDLNHNPAVSDGVKIKTSNHNHEWSYSLGDEDNEIIATCANNDSGHIGDVIATLIISAPNRTTYGQTGVGISENAILNMETLGDYTELSKLIKYQKKNADSTWNDLEAAPVDAGSYKAYITVDNKTAYVEYVINNASKDKPVSVGKTDESIKGIADGKITGVNSSMEYRKASDKDYTTITGTEVANLTSGEYKVRYAAVKNYNASDDVTVTIGYIKDLTVTFDSMGGSSVDSVTGLSYNDKVSKPEDPARDASQFMGWYLNGKPYDFNEKVKKDITLEAYWKINKSDVDITVGDDNKTTTKVLVIGETGVQASGLDGVARAVKNDGNTDNNVKIILTVDKTVETSENADQISDIKTEAGNKSVEFRDIDLTKYINGQFEGKINDTKGRIIEVIIPFNTSGKKNFAIYSYHEGEGVKTFVEEQTGADGTFYVKNNEIHLFTTKFSLYAVGYNTVSGGSNSDKGGDKDVSFSNDFVSDVSNGKVDISPKNAVAGQTVTVTVTPDEGYKLGKLILTDENGNVITLTKQNDTTYTYTMPDSKVNVEIAFDNTGKCPQDETCVYAKFNDSDTRAWYHDGVHFCVERGYMIGIADDQFAPFNTLSRGMIVTMLWRMEDSPVANYAMSFKDVADEMWYTEAIRWAQSTGVVLGYNDDAFGPDDNITREQLAAILMRYANFKGIDVSARANLEKYIDVESISDWALENIKWANAKAIITGRTETTIVPTGNATRAEAACMVQRFCETVLK